MEGCSMGRPIKKGSTDQSTVIRIIDSTDFTPETGVEHDTSGIDLWYRREKETKTSITEAALAALDSAHSDGGIEHIGDGYYRLDLPDAAVAAGSGENSVQIGGTVTGMIVIGNEHALVDYDPYDSVRAGLTALPNAAADAAGGLPISDAGGLDMDAIDSKIDTVDGIVDAILVDTGTTLPATLTTIEGKIDTVDTVVDGIQTDLDNGTDGLGALKTLIDTVDTNVDAILVDTGTTLPGTLTTIEGKIDTIDTNVDAVLVDTGTTLNDKIDVIDGIVDNILVDTGTTLPATLTTIEGKIDTIDGIVDDILVDTGTTLNDKIDTIDGIVDDILVDTGTTLPGTLTTIDGKIDTIDTNVDAVLVDTGTTLNDKIDVIDGIVDNILVDTGTTLQAELDGIQADTEDIQTQIGTAGAGLTDLGGMSTGMKAEVNAEMVDVVSTDTISEMSQGAPPASPTIKQILNYLYRKLRNKTETTSAEDAVYDDAGTTKLFKATLSDDATTLTKSEYISGA
jgi:hypothetical protein